MSFPVWTMNRMHNGHCSAFTEIKNFPLRLEGEKKQRTETEQDTGQLARE